MTKDYFVPNELPNHRLREDALFRVAYAKNH